MDSFSGLFVKIGDFVKCGVAQINVIMPVPTQILLALASVARISNWTRIGDFHDYAGVFSSTVASTFGVMTLHLQMLPTHLRWTPRTLTLAHISVEAIIAVASLAEGVRTATTTLRPIPELTSV